MTTEKTPDDEKAPTDATSPTTGEVSAQATPETRPDADRAEPSSAARVQAAAVVDTAQQNAANDSADSPTETPRPMPISDDGSARSSRKQRGPIARFFRSVFSHLLFAGVVVAGVLGYIYHGPILRDVGDTVCGQQALGPWMTTPPGQTIASRSATAPALSASQSAPMPAAAEPARREDRLVMNGPTTKSVTTVTITKGHAGPEAATEAASQTKATEPVAAAPVTPTASEAPAAPDSVATAQPATPLSKPDASAAKPVAPQAPAVETAVSPVSKVATKSGAVAASEPSVAAPPAQPSHAAPVAKSPATAVREAATSAAPVNTAPAASPNSPTATPNAPTAVAPKMAAASPAQQLSPAQQPTASRSVAEAIPTKPQSSAAAPAAATPDSRAQMVKEWAAAREAFSKGSPEAVTAYLDLAKRYPDVPELTGELGNIYYQQGKMAEAATQYYETAERLIRLGQPGPAACLLDVMRYLDADKAKALEAQTNVPCPAQRAQSN